MFSQVDLEGSVAALETKVRRRINFQDMVSDGWPSPKALEPFFLAPATYPWVQESRGSDEYALEADGLYGTVDRAERDRVVAHLTMIATLDFGVFLHYSKWDGRTEQSQDCFSKGDMRRLREWIRTRQRDLRPIGLFIPYAQAWKPVKEFMERDGELPTSIAWVDAEDLPPNTFRFPGFFRPGPEPRVLRDEDINDEPPDGTDPFRSLRR